MAMTSDRDTVRRRPETPLLGVLLALAGGALDGIVFVGHGVFANAQTGNLVLLGVGLARGDLRALNFLMPIGAFVLGVLAAHSIARARAAVRRPTRAVLGLETLVLVLASLLPAAAPAWMTVLPVSFAAALQSATFRSLGGQVYSSTMLTGNLRSLVLAVQRAIVDRDAAASRAALALALVLLAFLAGAGCGARLSAGFGAGALLMPAAVLLVVMVLIARETARLERTTRGPRA